MNLVTAAFAFKEGYDTSIQLNTKTGDSTTEMYLKNLVVSLASAKLRNPCDDVVLSTNIDLSEKWKKVFDNAGVKVRKIPFDAFVMPAEFPWSLAFYKLCVLKTWIDEAQYDRVLLIDADTFTTHPYTDMWQEADKGVLLYPLGHSYSHPDRETVRRDFSRLYPEESATLPITHYGGEYVCGNIRDMVQYVAKCHEIFKKIVAAGYAVEKKIGDETIWSIAAALAQKDINIIASTPYIYRFWTEKFYLISTVTVSNPVAIWHLPSEKKTGIIRLYDYYSKNGDFPKIEMAAKWMGIRKAKRPVDFITVQNKVNGKLRKWKIKE